MPGDLVADVSLVALPLVMIWRMRLPTQQRRLILIVVSGSILTIGTVVAFSVFCFIGTQSLDFTDDNILGAMMITLEDAVSLLVCNLFVIVTFFYRRISNYAAARVNGEREPPRAIFDNRPPCRHATQSASEKISATTFTDIMELDVEVSHSPREEAPSLVIWTFIAAR
ncbi:hypothetical protein NLJ89_g6565 [Agrocybe chaxingu]|uniref:Uncharacterized protein n=1 Tax=Agrocybe chaxingu TaxID=84603 RepID=A0A9W8JYI2_9AGAR|nr:hypothetical protein NLJ89_g6565 [Agrocybe chaxingu]